jgi:hypothetical protein
MYKSTGLSCRADLPLFCGNMCTLEYTVQSAEHHGWEDILPAS